MRDMILDSIYDKQNFGKGWLGYNVMARAPAAIFVQLLIAASLALALVLTPLTKKVVQKLWQQRQLTWHAPMFLGESRSCQTVCEAKLLVCDACLVRFDTDTSTDCPDQDGGEEAVASIRAHMACAHIS